MVAATTRKHGGWICHACHVGFRFYPVEDPEELAEIEASIFSEPDLEYVPLTVRLTKDLHARARHYAFEHNTSIAELCRRGIEEQIDRHKKPE